MLTRRASLGRYDEDAVQALLDRDPDPDAEVRSFAVSAARPTAEAKAEAWARVFDERAVPPGEALGEMAAAFWQPVQHHLLAPWADRYLEVVDRDARRGDAGHAEPGPDDGAGHRATTTGRTGPAPPASADGVDPLVRNQLLTAADSLARMIRAKG